MNISIVAVTITILIHKFVLKNIGLENAILKGFCDELAKAPPKNLKKSMPAKGKNAYQLEDVNNTANKAVRK